MSLRELQLLVKVKENFKSLTGNSTDTLSDALQLRLDCLWFISTTSVCCCKNRRFQSLSRTWKLTFACRANRNFSPWRFMYGILRVRSIIVEIEISIVFRNGWQRKSSRKCSNCQLDMIWFDVSNSLFFYFRNLNFLKKGCFLDFTAVNKKMGNFRKIAVFKKQWKQWGKQAWWWDGPECKFAFERLILLLHGSKRKSRERSLSFASYINLKRDMPSLLEIHLNNNFRV